MRAVATLAICSCYLLLGPGMILLNRHILVVLNWPYPVTLTALGAVFSSLVAFVLVHITGGAALPEPPITRGEWIRGVLPIGMCSAASLALGNIAYLHLSLSLVQMFKAGVPVLVLALLSMEGNTPSTRKAGAVMMISVGTVAAAFGGVGGLGGYSLLGAAAMWASNAAEAFRVVGNQRLLKGKGHAWGGLGLWPSIYYLQPPSAACLLLYAAATEWPEMSSSDWVTVWAQAPLFLLASAGGLAITLASLGTIAATSSLTLKLLGVVRNAALVLWGVLVLGDAVTTAQAAGYTLSVAGFYIYCTSPTTPAVKLVQRRGAAVATDRTHKREKTS
jgi:drug/metabolite transporter (DMT)-like permease